MRAVTEAGLAMEAALGEINFDGEELNQMSADEPRRGGFCSLTVGIGMGGGQTVRAFLCARFLPPTKVPQRPTRKLHRPWNEPIIANLMADPSVERVAVDQSSMLFS